MGTKLKKFSVQALVLLAAVALILSAIVAGTITSNNSNSNSEIKLSAEAATITSVGSSVTFNYTGGAQTFTATYSGYYTFDLYGAQGSSSGSHGYGGRAYGSIYLTAGTTFYVYVGGSGDSGGFNGGGQRGSYGGGATDIRLSSGSWNDTTGLRSRIMVAGGGGGHCENSAGYGGYGGGLTGTEASSYDNESVVGSYHRGKAGTQTSGGAAATCGAYTAPGAGGFGYGGASGTCGHDSSHWGGSGGGGYYGGGAGQWHAGGGGGSSFVSGLSGCNAIDANGNHTGQSVHYSGYAFYNAGTSTGVRGGNGYATVTYNGTLSSLQEITMNYTGYGYTYTIPVSGYYQLSCWGAGGGYIASGYGAGAYVTGRTFFTRGTKVYIFVGGAGSNGGYNGGGSSSATDRYGGGATDFRMTGQYDWNNSTSLQSRILVAGGGGGHNSAESRGGGGYGNAGIYSGENGYYHSSVGYSYSGLGGSQSSGGAYHDVSGYAGGFGYGGAGIDNSDGHAGGGGGGGYYGGSGSRWHAGGGGGSSYVNGYSGFSTTYKVSGYSFSNVSWSTGSNTGNGYAKIKYIYDNTSPSNATISAQRDISRYYNSVYTSFSGSSDTESGYGSDITYKYSLDGTNFTNGTSVTISSSLSSGTETKTLYVRVYDYIGNYSQVTKSFLFDRNNYSISYVYDSGWSNPSSNPSSYNVESSAITFVNMSRTGYTFSGWYTDSGKTSQITTLATQSTGNRTLYAKTNANSYTITFDGQSATKMGTTSLGVTYDATVSNITVPTRTGYTFGGYYGGTNGSGTQYFNASGVYTSATWTYTSNPTVYAKWTANKYDVSFDGQNCTSAGTTKTQATYDSAMPSITLPTKTGFTFQGYYTQTGGSGTQYYTATGASAVSYTTAGTMTLYACWKINQIATPTISGDDISKVYNGNETTYTCSVTPHGLAIAYQWYKDGSAISGATSATYTVKDVADSGKYACTVKVASDGQSSSATSAVKTVSITKKPLTLTWTAYNDKYCSYGAPFTYGSSPESGDGSSDAPYIYFWSGEQVGLKLAVYGLASVDEDSGVQLTLADSLNSAGFYILTDSLAAASTPTATYASGGTVVVSSSGVSGAHNISLTTSSANYSVDGTVHSYKISKRPMTLEFSEECTTKTSVYAYVFDGNLQGIYFKTPNNGLGNSFDYSYTVNGGSAETVSLLSGETCKIKKENANTYAISVTLASGTDNFVLAKDVANGTYTECAQTVTFTIAPKEIAGNTTFDKPTDAVYCGSAIEKQPALKDTVRGIYLVSGTDFEYSYLQNVNVGIATVVATAKGNYKGTNSVTFKIAAKSIIDATVKVESIAAFEYTGSQIKPTITVSDEERGVSLTLGEKGGAGDFYVYYGENINAGERGGSVIVYGMNNYQGQTTAINFRISKKSIGAKLEGDSEFVYDKKVKSLNIVATDYVSTEEAPILTINYDSGCTNVGTYKARVSLNAKTYPNYTLASDIEYSLKITEKPMEVSFSGYEDLVYNGLVRSVSVAFKQGYTACAGDTVAIQLSYGEGVTLKNAGDYTVTASLNDSNYKIIGENSVSFSVARKAISSEGKNFTKTFGDADPDFNILIPSGTPDGSITVKASRSREGDLSDYEHVGKYSFSDIDASSATNYDVTLTTDCTLTINVKSLTFTPKATSKTYGYDDVAIEQEINTYAFGIVMKAIFTREEGEEAGNYDYTSVTYSSAQETEKIYEDCFSIKVSNTAYMANKFTILKRKAVVNIPLQSKIYGEEDGEFIYEIDPAAIASRDNDIPVEELFNLIITRVSGEDYVAAGYPMFVTSGNNNYDITISGANVFMIYKREIIFTSQTVVETEKYYDGNSTAKSTIGEINLDKEMASRAQLSVSATYASKNVGDMEITVNYKVAYGMENNFVVPKSYKLEGKILPAVLQAIPSSISYEYGADKIPEVELEYVGFVSEENTETIDFEAPVYSMNGLDSHSHAGTYQGQITLSGGYAPNYEFDYGTGDVLITKAKLTVVEKTTYIRRADGTLDAYLEPRHYAYVGAKFDDEKNFVLSFTAKLESAEPGNTSVFVTITGINDDNYYVYNKSFVVSAILQNAPSISASSEVYDYDGTTKHIKVNASILGEPYDNIIVTYASENYPESVEYPTDAGVYTVKIIADEDDLRDSPTYATLTINKLTPVVKIGAHKSNYIYGEFESLTATIALLNETFAIEPTYDFVGTRPNVGLHSVTVSYPETTNYNAAFTSVYFNVDPIETTVKFSGYENIIYNGKPQYPVAKIVGALEGDEQNAKLLFADDITPINAGTYTVQAVSPNGNYVLRGTVTMTYTINKRTLKVTINSGTQVVAGTNPQLELVYDGFAEGDDASSLADIPRSNIVGGKIGTNSVQLFGGADSNYEYEYEEDATVEVIYEPKTTQINEDGSATSKFAGSTLYIVLGVVGGVVAIVIIIAVTVRKRTAKTFIAEHVKR